MAEPKPDERMPADLRALGQMVAERHADLLAELDLVDDAARAVERAPRRKRASRRAAIFGAAGLAACVAAVVLVFALRRPAAAMTFVAAGTEGAAGVWLDADDRELPLTFSDGSTVLTQPGSRLRVGELSADGAELELERGVIAASVRHREHTRWRFRVGPFSVQVTGTRFDASWDPDTQSLEVSMQDGSVRVSGPRLVERTLVAGQRLRFSLERTATAPATPHETPGAHEAPTAALVPSESTEAASPLLAAPTTPTHEPTGRATPLPRAASWDSLAEQGDYDEGFRAAEREGFDALCRSLPAHSLLELGDTARFARRDDRAEQAYLAVRARYPASNSSARAAFDLGVIARGDARVRWFESYLAEAPNGPLAREALGRLIELRVAAGDRAAARQHAARYLASFSDGPHAGLARELLDRQ